MPNYGEISRNESRVYYIFHCRQPGGGYQKLFKIFATVSIGFNFYRKTRITFAKLTACRLLPIYLTHGGKPLRMENALAGNK